MGSLNQDDSFISCLENIVINLNDGNNLVNSDLLIEFQSKVENLAENMKDIKKTERVLKIGIVGEVKAGKSSFLNSLIFDGETVLPKAPTPMTAALTKLGYSDTPSAKIVFYTDYDWEKIEGLASEYNKLIHQQLEIQRRNYSLTQQGMGYTYPMPSLASVEATFKDRIPSQYSACRELTRMVDESGIILNDYLGKTVEIKGKSSYSDYMDELNNYVGTGGLFTPIVKHTEILINNPLLKDIEVVDTPGLNDPILSRSETTKKFLINCDVVFLLSYAGQFLGSEDIEFLTKTLPSEGIRKAILVGSKFDSGILDYNVRNVTFKEAFIRSRKNFDSQAQINVQSCTKSQNCPAAIKEIEKSLPPKYISSLMYSAGKKMQNNKQLSEEEDHILKQMKMRFKGFDDSPSSLIDFSNIINIKNDVFATLKSEKDKTISERIMSLTSSQTGRFISILEEININAKNNLSDLSKYDCAQLQEKLKSLKQKLDSIRREVKNIFEMSSVDAQRILRDLTNDVEKEIDNYSDVSISARIKNRRETERTGFLGWKKEVYNVTETINSANVSEVISNLRKYATRAKKVVNEEFVKLFDINNLKRNVKNTVIGAFDLSDRNFNENDILIPLEVVLKKLTIPSIEINLENYDELILRQFSSGVVEGHQISELVLAQEKALQVMAKDITDSILKTEEKIESILQEQAGVFVDNIERQLSNNVEILQKLLEDKENNIIEYEKFISSIADYKGQISKFRK